MGLILMDIKILIAAHKKYWMPKDSIYLPLNVGAEGKAELGYTGAYCRYTVDQVCIPLAPHLYLPQFLDEESERELALFMDIALLSRCVELWVFGDVISAGMEKEIQYAQRKGKPIRYINEVK